MRNYKIFLLSILIGIFPKNLVHAQWVPTGPFSINYTLPSFAASGANLYAAIGDAIFCSTNGGTSWRAVLTVSPALQFTSFAVSETSIFAGTTGAGVILSTDDGASWSTTVNNDYVPSIIIKLFVSDTNLFAVSYNSIYLSTNNGTNWNEVYSTQSLKIINTLLVSDTNLFVGTSDGLYLFSKNGADWKEVDSSLANTSINSLLVSDKYLFAGTDSCIYLSTDTGKNWSSIGTDLPRTTFHTLIFSNMQLFAGTDSGIFISTDNGTSWTAQNNGLTNLSVYSLLVTDNKLLVGTLGGIFISTNNGVNWSSSNTGISNSEIHSIAGSGTNLFAGTYGGVFHTANSTDWARVDTGFSKPLINSVLVSGSNIFAGTWEGLYRSTNDGSNWARVDSGFFNSYINSLAISGTTIIASTNYGFYRSINNGTSWEKANSGLPALVYFPSGMRFTVIDSNIFAGSLWLSTNNGINWTNIGINGIEPPSSINAIASINTNLFAATFYGVYRSTDNGASWTSINVDSTTLINSALAVSGTNLFVGNAKGVFMSSNNGQSWEEINTGFPKFSLNDIEPFSQNIRTLFVSGNNLFAGTNGIGIWKRPLSEITEVQENSDDVPKKYALEQNYPNPFNPSTTISFSISSRSFVSLKVFDILGREVATIISQEMPVGRYSRQWNASALSSGVYFYRLQAGSFIETKKLILLR